MADFVGKLDDMIGATALIEIFDFFRGENVGGIDEIAALTKFFKTVPKHGIQFESLAISFVSAWTSLGLFENLGQGLQGETGNVAEVANDVVAYIFGFNIQDIIDQCDFSFVNPTNGNISQFDLRDFEVCLLF